MDIYFILLLILRYLLSFPWQQGVREDKNCKLRGMTLSIHLSPYLEVMASISFFLFLIEKKPPLYSVLQASSLSPLYFNRS